MVLSSEQGASAPLLATKIHVPRPRHDIVSRPRLSKRLEEGIERKLTLISAPAGSGKTTALSQFLASGQKKEWPAAWVSLDDSDSDPTRFWSYFGEALGTVQAGVGQHLVAALQSPQPPPMEFVLTTLINEIAQTLDDFIFLIDDYHVIDAQPIHDALGFLVENLPPLMHLVIATRTDPPLPLSRLRARGELTEVRATELRFTPDEANEFLNRTLGLSLSHEDIAELEERTEGWAAGLHLAALSVQGRDDVHEFVTSFTGGHRYVFEYLGNEVLNRQSPGVQSFLLQTSILDRLSGPLCDAVTGQTDSRITLRMLQDSNLFIAPLDEDRHWYRYHHLFAEFLREHLYERHADRVSDLHIAASRWHEKNGSISSAIEHSISAGDFEGASQLVERVGGPMWMRGEFTTLARWLGALPDRVIRMRAGLCVMKAMASLMEGHLDAVEPLIDDAERLVSNINGAERDSESRDASMVMGQVAAIRGFVACLKGEIVPAVEYSRQALEHLPREASFMRSAVMANLVANLKGASASHSSVGVDEAIEAMREAVGLSRTNGEVFATLFGLGWIGEMEASQGRLFDAEKTCREALEFEVRQGDRPTATGGMAHIVLGDVLREWNDLEAARQQLGKAIEMSQQDSASAFMNLGTRMSGYVGLARVLQAQGDGSASDVIDQTEELARQSGVPRYVGQIRAYQAWIRLGQGDLARASAWARSSGMNVGDEIGEGRVGEYTILARVLTAEGNTAEAVELLNWLMGEIEPLGLARNMIEVLALTALALDAAGDRDQALIDLQRALSLAEPGGFVRTFVDEGAPMAALLRHAAAHGIAQGYATRLLDAFEGPGAGSHERAQLLEEPLSERELEVLGLVAEGMTNAQIAADLIVAISTVKTHINNIYGKLAVGNRTQAVAKAREIRLID